MTSYIAEDYSNGGYRQSDIASPLTTTEDRSRNAPIVAACILIGMRQASRGATMTNNRTDGGAPGTGIGEDGDPCPTLAHSHVPAVMAFDERNVTSKANRSNPQPGDPMFTLHSAAPSIAWKESQSGTRVSDVHATLDGNKGSRRMEGVLSGYCVRRLMPIECERCQGMPDDWTRFGVKEDGGEVELSDSARYRLIGNSVAVPVVEWIGKRILATQ